MVIDTRGQCGSLYKYSKTISVQIEDPTSLLIIERLLQDGFHLQFFTFFIKLNHNLLSLIHMYIAISYLTKFNTLETHHCATSQCRNLSSSSAIFYLNYQSPSLSPRVWKKLS